MAEPAHAPSKRRRRVLQGLAGGAGALCLTGCERAISGLGRMAGQSLPEQPSLAATGEDFDPAYHLLNRAAFGPWPGQLDDVRQRGWESWIDWQLKPDAIEDRACDLRARRFESLALAPGNAFELKREVIREELIRHTLLRAVYSRRQLFEVMVGFWTDHLNIDLEKGDCIYLKPHDDREVIRKHALGRFRDLIRASVTSPAMLVYLDGNENRVGDEHGDVPNENYARELLELHTLGVDGGYTQDDVMAAARCLTGWHFSMQGWRRGRVRFEPRWHDSNEQVVLGTTIPAGLGPMAVDRLVDIVCSHPATARHISWKLARRFVAPEPPERLIDRLAAEFTRTDGDIRSVLRVLLLSSEFRLSAGMRFRRPFEFIVASLRAMAADTHAHAPLIEYLTRMGQGPFQHPTPDGYPDEAGPWMGGLLWRWNFALALVSGGVPDVRVDPAGLTRALRRSASGDDTQTDTAMDTGPTEELDLFFRHFTGRPPTNGEREALRDYRAAARLGEGRALEELMGLVIASPGFQVC